MSWSLAFLPVWLALALVACAPCFRWSFRDDLQVFVATIMALWIPTLVAAVLLVIKLDASSMTLAVALIPFWAVNGCIACAFCGASVFAVLKACNPANRRCAGLARAHQQRS